MKENRIGRQIEYIRKKEKISQTQLRDGICTESGLYRIEQGEHYPDFMVVSALYSRLGKSVNKLEILFRGRDYLVCYQQEKIELAMEIENYPKVYEMLAQYRTWKAAVKEVHLQYILMMESVLYRQADHDHKRAVDTLLQAIQITIPKFDIGKISNGLFSEREITLVLMWIEERILLGYSSVEQECRQVICNLEQRNLDEEVYVNLYPKAMWLMAQIQQKEGKLEELVDTCEKVQELLVKNQILTGMTCFIEKELQVLRILGWKEKEDKLAQWRDALVWVYQEAGQEYPKKEMQIWKNYHQKKIYVFEEMVRMERKNLGASQTDMAQTLGVKGKTLSRIELGRHLPQNYTYHKLMEVLNLNRELCDTKLKVDQFELLELERDIAREQSFGNYEKARQIFRELAEQLSLAESVNRQYVEYMELAYEVIEGSVSDMDAIQRAVRIFEWTRKWNIENFSKIVLNQLETKIANFIARMYRETGQETYAIKILESVLEGFDASMVGPQHRYVEYALLLGSLSCYCETSGQFEKALWYAQRGIRLDILCGRGFFLGKQLLQKIYIQEQMGDAQCLKKYRQLYPYFMLMKMEQNAKIIEEHCKKLEQSNFYTQNMKETIY